MSTTEQVRAEGVRWDLSSLFPDGDDARRELVRATTDAESLATRYRGRLSDLDGPGLARLLSELADIDNRLSRISSYAHLREAIDAESSENRDLVNEIDRGMVEATNHLRFVELEWNALPDDVALPLASAQEVAADHHYLVALRRFAPHQRTEPEERMLAERQTAAVNAWQSLFNRINSTLSAPFDDGTGTAPHTVDRLLALIRRPERHIRRGALDTLYGMLDPQADTLAHCYDTLVGDRLVMDRLRGYAHPMAYTHLRNEVPAAAVERMMSRVEEAYPVAQRWFRAKARILGIEDFHLSDQYAPIGTTREVRYPEATRIIDASFRAFAPPVADLSAEIVASGRMDAEPRPGKRGGAFCAPVAQDGPVFVLMNFNDRFSDVMTMAHELGHAMHFVLSCREQTAHSAFTGLALAEVPSTFAETVTLEHVLASEPDAATRRTLMFEHVEGIFASVFRQNVLARYEERAYAARSEGLTLTAERLGDIWIEENRRYYGDAVELPDGYRLGWAYIPHFISTRFYTYAYVFACLVALTLTVRRREDPDRFAGPYLHFLGAGGSAAPTDLLRPLGVELDDPGVWDTGVAELERLIAEAEALAA